MADLRNIEGLAELDRALHALPGNIAKNVLRGAVGAGAAVIRKEAKSRAPVAEGPQRPDAPPPGTLQRAIYSKWIRELSDWSKQTFIVSVKKGRKYRKAGKKYTDAFYWWFVENGTSKMAARPYLRPAFEAKKTEAIEAIRDYLAKRIPLEVEKLRRK
jgi:HK97 gp10 family phage protein